MPWFFMYFLLKTALIIVGGFKGWKAFILWFAKRRFNYLNNPISKSIIMPEFFRSFFGLKKAFCGTKHQSDKQPALSSQNWTKKLCICNSIVHSDYPFNRRPPPMSRKRTQMIAQPTQMWNITRFFFDVIKRMSRYS